MPRGCLDSLVLRNLPSPTADVRVGGSAVERPRHNADLSLSGLLSVVGLLSGSIRRWLRWDGVISVLRLAEWARPRWRWTVPGLVDTGEVCGSR